MISVATTERFPTRERPRRRNAVDLARADRAGAPDADPADARDAPRERSRASDRLRILLVEDNPGDVELVRGALDEERADASLLHVERISEAIVRARAGACDVVLLDLSLPDSGGLEGARRLRAECPDLPIVVLTSLEDDRLAAQAVAEGAQDYLVKGRIDGALLVRSIRYAVERQRYAESARQLAAERSARLAAEAAIAALRASENRFRAVLDQVHDHAIFQLDPEGRVASWSKSASLLKGWSPEEILGRRFDCFFPPEDVARGKPGAELLEAARVGHTEDESWRLRKDGSRFLANASVTALHDEQGRLLGFVKVTRDVTGRRRTERNVEFLGRATHELAQSLDPRAALEHLAGMVVPYLADSCCAFVLAEEGASCELVASACADPAKERLALEAARGFPVGPWPTFEVIEQLRRGEPVFLPELGEPELRAMARSEDHLELLRSAGLRSSIVVPLRARGALYGGLTLGMTQPERRFDRVDLELAVDLGRRAELAVENARLFEEVQRAVRVREDVLAVVSHDLKGPLSVIQLAALSAARMLDKAGGGDPAIRHQVDSIQRGVRRATVLLRDLLDMASIRAGRLAIRTSQEDAESVLAETVEAHEALAREKGISLSSGGTAGLSVECDRDRLLQVFANAITNAITFCRSGDRIDLAVAGDGRFATFTVADTGPGIAEDALPLVFEAYWSGARQAGHGTGLGLFISKGIVEAHGGRVWIESRVGQGTTLRFTVPIAAA